eukprot:s1082_g16.t1
MATHRHRSHRASVVAALLAVRHASQLPLPFTCLVVRHGETDWNRQLRVQGRTDVPLNAKGRLQAERCADAVLAQLQRHSSTILSSSLERAAATAEAIATAMRAEVRKDIRLNEWNLGIIEGMSPLAAWRSP